MLSTELSDRLANLELSDWLLLIVAPFIGSFLGTLAMRLPAGDAPVFGRSRCDHCRHNLGALDLVPVLSWAAAGGRCRHCVRR